MEVAGLVICVGDDLCEPFLLDAGVCGHPVSETVVVSVSVPVGYAIVEDIPEKFLLVNCCAHFV